MSARTPARCSWHRTGLPAPRPAPRPTRIAAMAGSSKTSSPPPNVSPKRPRAPPAPAPRAGTPPRENPAPRPRAAGTKRGPPAAIVGPPREDGVMAKNGFRMIDAEMHVMEPTDLGQRYMDPECRERGPRRLDERRWDIRTLVEGEIMAQIPGGDWPA